MGISPQNMARNMLQYLKIFLDPEIAIDYLTLISLFLVEIFLNMTNSLSQRSCG